MTNHAHGGGKPQFVVPTPKPAIDNTPKNPNTPIPTPPSNKTHHSDIGAASEQPGTNNPTPNPTSPTKSHNIAAKMMRSLTQPFNLRNENHILRRAARSLTNTKKQNQGPSR